MENIRVSYVNNKKIDVPTSIDAMLCSEIGPQFPYLTLRTFFVGKLSMRSHPLPLKTIIPTGKKNAHHIVVFVIYIKYKYTNIYLHAADVIERESLYYFGLLLLFIYFTLAEIHVDTLSLSVVA